MIISIIVSYILLIIYVNEIEIIMAALRWTDIDVILVRNYTEINSTDVGTLCSHFSINRWSRWKPISYAKTGDRLTEAEMKSANFGLELKTITLNTIENPQEWSYNKPKGGISSPYRLSDFGSYNKDAAPFLLMRDITWKSAQTPLDSLNILPTFKWGSGVNEGQTDGITSLYNIEIYPSDLKYSGSSFDFSIYYIGICTVINGSQHWIWSNKAIGQATYVSPLLINFADANTNLKQYMNNTMKTGDSLEFTPVIANIASVNAAYMFSFPMGQKITVTKSNEILYDLTLLESTYISSRRGLMGTLQSLQQNPVVQSGEKIYKPLSADSGEIITIWIKCKVTSSVTTAVVANTLSLSYSGILSGVTMFDRYQGSQIASTSITANQTVEFWISAQNIPASLFFNLPNYNGSQTTVVAMSANLQANNVNILPRVTYVGRWMN